MIKRNLAALILGAGLGAISPFMTSTQKAALEIKPTVNYRKLVSKMFYRESHIRRYVKTNNGKPQTGAAALKRAASKRKAIKARSSKRK